MLDEQVMVTSTRVRRVAVIRFGWLLSFCGVRVHLMLQDTLPLSAPDNVRNRSRDVAQPGRAHPWGG
jgi:hypothetical protein